MAWDSSSNTGRRRGNSTLPKLSQSTKTQETSKSIHTADPALQPFLSSAPFNPAEYLNATLPALQTSGTASSRSGNVALPLAELSTQTQTLLSHLSAHTTRLTNTLTQLTDEILRSGSRLAYEVEVLRGETVGLSEALTEGLQEDITKFVPSGLEAHLAPKPSESHSTRRRSSTILSPKIPTTPRMPTTPKKLPVDDLPPAKDDDPEYIKNLRTLTLVRTRLETVIQVFGDAMAWTFPPSEISVSSSFLSVSAPEPGSSQHSTEEKGQEISKKIRDEISDLLLNVDDPVEGIASAAKRVEELKELARIWKGTAEERGRGKFVEGLAKMVEERHAEFLREGEKETQGAATRNSREDSRTASTGGNANVNATANGAGDGRFGGGFDLFNRLQSLRGAS